MRLVGVRWWSGLSDDLDPLAPEDGIDRYLRHREPSLRESSMRNARTRLRFFQEWCDERDIENLNGLAGRDLADFVAWRRGDISAITLQKQLSTIRMALRYWADIEAVTEGLAEKLHAPELPDGAESREVALDADRAEAILEYLSDHHYASRDHVIMVLLWRTAMRRGALRSIDVGDLEPDDNAIRLEHRPDAGTKLKNGEDGERWVYLGPTWYQPIEDYLNNPDRHDVTDENGRQPLITSQHGRPTGDTIYNWVNKLTQPCKLRGCPHDRDVDTCEALGHEGYPSRCPSARSPHAIRRGSITHHHLNKDVSPEIVSERCDVSLEVLYEHYDVRTEQEKMSVRKRQLEEV